MGGGSRAGLKPSEDLSPDTEQGIVGGLKDGFGFIRCADRDGEMFFHFSDLLAGGADRIKRGDEVSFKVATDSRDGRTRALSVEILPKGSVEFEKVIESGVRGVVTKELMGQYKADNRGGRGRGKASLADSLAQGRAEAYGGKIKRLDAATAAVPAEASAAAGSASAPAAAAPTPASSPAPTGSPSSEQPSYEFSERDLTDPNILLYVGDIIEFSVFLERKSKRQGATKLKLVEPNPQGRERGRVVSIKENFGFIAVEEEMADDDDDTAPPQQHGGRGGYHGKQQEQQIFFHFSELVDAAAPLPQVGDELSFLVAKSPAEGNKLSAQRIFTLPKGSLNSREVSKETYTGTVLREIAFEEEKQESKQIKQKGDKAGAAAKEEPAAAASDAAAAAATPSSSPAPSPASSPRSDAPASSPNPLARGADPSASSSGSGSTRPPARKLIPGLLSYTDASGATVELTFRPSDLAGANNRDRPLVLKGDTATFRILTTTRKCGVSKRATQISVPQSGWTKLNREQGIVSQVKEGGFGFVDSVSRVDKIFLHQSNVARPAGQQQQDKKDENPRERRQAQPGELVVGLEVEFTVQNTNGKLSAIRASVLPPGTVQFEENLPGTFSGVISRSMKVREAAPAAPKDGSSFSKNDLRSDQGAQGGRPQGKGEKGEIKNLALSSSGDAADASSSSASAPEIHLPKDGVSFYDADVIAPAAMNLDASSFIVGDVVSCSLRRHKATKKLSAFNVQLQQMNPASREKGQVSRIKEREGTGIIQSLSRSTPLVFSLKDAPKNISGERVQEGDCFEFNVSEANAGSKKDRAQYNRNEEPAQAHAVRLTPLPRDSVQVESVDRSRKVRGFISAMPEKVGAGAAGSSPAKGGKPISRPGQVVVLPSERVAPVLNSALTHPASWNLDVSANWAVYSAAGIHAASTKPEGAPKPEGEEKYAFTLKDLVSKTAFVSKGDLVDFYLAVRNQPPLTKRLVEVTLVPLQGVVEKIDPARGGASSSSAGGDGGAYTGLIQVYNPQAARSEESFYFSSADFLDASSGAPLAVGDLVEFTDVLLSQSEKRRQAKGITRSEGSNRTAEGQSRAQRTICQSRSTQGADSHRLLFCAVCGCVTQFVLARSVALVHPSSLPADSRADQTKKESDSRHEEAHARRPRRVRPKKQLRLQQRRPRPRRSEGSCKASEHDRLAYLLSHPCTAGAQHTGTYTIKPSF